MKKNGSLRIEQNGKKREREKEMNSINSEKYKVLAIKSNGDGLPLQHEPPSPEACKLQRE